MRDSLVNGSYLPIYVDGIRPPIKFKLKNGKIFVNALIFDIEHKLVVEIRDNEFIVPNTNMRIKYDNTAFEVVDEHNIPVLQIEFYDSKTVVLGGMFYKNNVLFIFTDHSSIQQPNISSFYENEKRKRELLQALLEYSDDMTKIFKYTGSESEAIRNYERRVPKIYMHIYNLESHNE